MSKPKTIYCPQCGREVIHYDGRSTVNQMADCRKCKKRIVYHIESGETEIKSIPIRACNSGITFH